MSKLVKVAQVSELSAGEGTVVNADDQSIALFNVDGTFYAIDNTCTHMGGPLAEGDIDGDIVTCPWHGAGFSVKTGDCTCGPEHRMSKATLSNLKETTFLLNWHESPG